jgi:hypothetical protein
VIDLGAILSPLLDPVGVAIAGKERIARLFVDGYVIGVGCFGVGTTSAAGSLVKAQNKPSGKDLIFWGA